MAITLERVGTISITLQASGAITLVTTPVSLTFPQAPVGNDHHLLGNLTLDDHPQYHNDARGDARYSPLAHNHDGVYSQLGHTHTHASLTALDADDHAQYLRTDGARALSGAWAANGRIYHSSAALNIGAAAATSQGLGTGGVLAGGALEVDGVLYADGGVRAADGVAGGNVGLGFAAFPNSGLLHTGFGAVRLQTNGTSRLDFSTSQANFVNNAALDSGCGMVASGAMNSAAGSDGNVVFDTTGVVALPLTTNVAPNSLMIRPAPCYAGGAQAAAHIVLAPGQDETKIDIDDWTQGAPGDNVIVRVMNSNGVVVSTTLTVVAAAPNSVQWVTATSNNATATSLATAVNQIAGISAIAVGAQVQIKLKPTTANVLLTESKAALTTVSTGTSGAILIPGDNGSTSLGYAFLKTSNLSNNQVGWLFGNNQIAAVNTLASLSSATVHAGTRVTIGTSSGNGGASLDVTDGLFYGSLATGYNPISVTGLIGTSIGYVRRCWLKGSWTNAGIVALGAVTTSELTFVTLKAKVRVLRAFVEITGQAAGVTTLTASVGRTGTPGTPGGFIDYVKAADAKVAANTIYGDAKDGSETGTNLFSTFFIDDLPSWTGTTVVKIQFTSSGGNLSAVTGSTGAVYLEVEALP